MTLSSPRMDCSSQVPHTWDCFHGVGLGTGAFHFYWVSHHPSFRGRLCWLYCCVKLFTVCSSVCFKEIPEMCQWEWDLWTPGYFCNLLTNFFSHNWSCFKLFVLDCGHHIMYVKGVGHKNQRLHRDLWGSIVHHFILWHKLIFIGSEGTRTRLFQCYVT
jgi:hypothetical protein